MSEQDTINGEEELNRWFTASTSIDANLPIEVFNESNSIFQYDKNTNTDKVLVPLDTGGYVSVGSKPAEFMSTPSSNKMMGVAVPKYSNGRGYDNYFNNLGRAVKTFTDPMVETVKATVSGVGQGIDMTTDMLSDFAGKYMQFKFDPNLFDGEPFLPDINPKQILMDATGFQGVDLSAFEPETIGGKAAKDIITYIVAATLTPSKGLGLVKGGIVRGAGSLGATAPEFGNLFTLARDLGFENDLVAYLDAKIENPEDATLDERLASRLKGMSDAPLEAGILFTAAKTIANRAVQLATGAATGTALSAQEAEGGPLGTFVRQSLKRGVKQVDSVPQTKIDPQDNIARIEAPTDNQSGIIAFHGSGADFDEFKLDKIGSGEGAQVYGYGLYFTEKESIAKYYKNQIEAKNELSGKVGLKYKGKDFVDLGDTAASEAASPEYFAIARIKDEINRTGQEPKFVQKNILKRLDKEIEKYNERPDSTIKLDDGSQIEDLIVESLRQEKEALLAINSDDIEIARGKTYKVALSPKPEELLDYDLPFSDQSAYVKKALRKHKDAMLSDSDVRTILTNLQDGYTDLPGAEIVDALKQIDGTGKRASKYLNQLGIKGIKYRASGSRNPNMDTEDVKDNFVIFDDAAINILAKYGIVGPVAVTALSKPEFTKNEQ